MRCVLATMTMSVIVHTVASTFIGQPLHINRCITRCSVPQEVGWFDRDENNSAAITGRLAVDAMAVRGAVGDQLGMFTQNMVTLLGGYIIALINGWRMALVVIATLPLIAVAAGFAVKVEGDFSSKADELFSGANKLAMEAFTSIRTVAAFTMEKQVGLGDCTVETACT